MKIPGIIILLAWPFALLGQSANQEGPYVNFKNKPSFFLTLDRTNSFIAGKGASTNELRIGLDFKRKIRLGIGVAGLTSDVVEKKTITTESNHDSTLNARLSLTYLTLSAEYTLYDRKRWQITIPVTTGIGTSYFTYYENVGGAIKTKRLSEQPVVTMVPSTIVTYRILRWVGLSAGSGYRIMLRNNDLVKQRISSPIYIFRVRIFMGEIYKSVFPRGISGKRNPPYSNEYWD